MTMTIELTPEEEARVREKAKRDGRKPEDLIVALAMAGMDTGGPPPGYWDGFVGVVSSSEASDLKSNLSENTGAAFTEILLENKVETK